MRIEKILLFLILTGLVFQTQTVGADEIAGQGLTPKIDQVMVYQDRARITRRLLIPLPQGPSRLILEGFPGEMNQQSLQVVGRGHALIREVTVKPAPPGYFERCNTGRTLGPTAKTTTGQARTGSPGGTPEPRKRAAPRGD